MIDDPGSFSGIEISASPALGPEANHLISLAIFIKSAAKAFNVPCNCTTSSCEVNAWNLFSDDTKLYPVFSEINLATLLPNSGCALIPVPTAVPPIAKLKICFFDSANNSSHLSNI